MNSPLQKYSDHRSVKFLALLASERFWLCVFLLLALAVFWPARQAGFVTDWLGGQERYETGTFRQALQSFGWVAILPVLFTLNFTLFKLFGTAWLPWFLIFTMLHAANGWQLFRLVNRLLRGGGGVNGQWVAVATGALFLLSPYAVEPIVWKGCIQYPLSLLLLLIALQKTLDFMERPRWRTALLIHGLFLTAIYLTEWNIIVPFLIIPLIVVKTGETATWPSLRLRLTRLVGPQLAILAGWFLLNKIYLGHWVGHYGSATHLQVRPAAMFGTGLKYLAKYAGFTRYFDHGSKERVFAWFDQSIVLAVAAGLLALLFGAYGFYFTRLSSRWRWAGWGLAAFFVALVPVSNLFFYWLQWSENDRYGYYAAGFFWMFVLLVLAGLPRRIFRLVVVALLLISLVLQIKMTMLWGQSEEIYASLVRDFRWYDREEVIILASPDNLKGVPMLRIIGQQSGFDEALALRRHQPYTGKMWEVAQFNLEKPTDGVKVARDSTGLLLQASFRQDGNWWWRNGIGVTDYASDRYTFQVQEWHVDIRLLDKRPHSAIIYPVSGRWLEVPQ